MTHSEGLDSLFTTKSKMEDPENLAKNLFEIASEQRLKILFLLREKKYSVSKTAKELDATVPEVFRNFQRLAKASLIEKDPDGLYDLTLYGKTVCNNLPSLFIVSKFEKYFKNHNYGNIPPKFIQRIGALSGGQHIKGVVKVLEIWKKVHDNAKEYIYNILAEVPYSSDIIETVASQAKKGTKIHSIFSNPAIIPESRKEIFEKLHFKKYIDNGTMERKMMEDATMVVLLNEKEACVLFPSKEGEPDMSEMLYSKEPMFHEWCLDYFKNSWEQAGIFQERKLK